MAARPGLARLFGQYICLLQTGQADILGVDGVVNLLPQPDRDRAILAAFIADILRPVGAAGDGRNLCFWGIGGQSLQRHINFLGLKS